MRSGRRKRRSRSSSRSRQQVIPQADDATSGHDGRFSV
jgi:hypothetical protein